MFDSTGIFFIAQCNYRCICNAVIAGILENYFIGKMITAMHVESYITKNETKREALDAALTSQKHFNQFLNLLIILWR